ncbi:MFS transporter [Paraburkholderia hayleyella]|uniref:MFS transporter n=1 Tax=Paraburkholderia hayleyella TaxID=2152889 RepID=UPI001290C5A5|nr:MFS transporter [Paraburkholderia hayleyella]
MPPDSTDSTSTAPTPPPCNTRITRFTRFKPHASTSQILPVVFFTFLCYLTIGIPLAVLPGYVHGDLGYSTILAGAAISLQYLATLASRPLAGRTADTLGPKQAVALGLTGCALSGALLFAAALCQPWPGPSLILLALSRILLGCGESLCGTGAILWGIGRSGPTNNARVISWNGIATYGALAAGAPLGVALMQTFGFASLGLAVLALAVAGYTLARRVAPVPVVHGERMKYRSVFTRVLPHGIGLALGSAGFGVIATFITLFYAAHHWPNAALSLTVFGTLFIGARLLFSNAIRHYGGFRVAVVSFALECAGLLMLWLAPDAHVALAGAALTGIGFALVFPALGVEAVALVPPASRGAALSAYSVFLDLSLGITGPLAGLIAGAFGYSSVFLFAAIASAAAAGLSALLYRRSRQALAADHRQATTD